VRTSKNSELHAVEPLPSSVIAIADMEYERIAVVEDGSIVWQWNASVFYDAPRDPTKRDWLHINDVNYIGDDRFLVSVRNANQLLVIERGAGVVEVIINTPAGATPSKCGAAGERVDYDGDGTVRCGNPAVLERQHNLQWLGKGAVLVADSDNNRIVELHRTPNSSWAAVWIVRGAGNMPFFWPRETDRLPSGTTLISDTWNQRILEINASGQVLWSTRTDPQPYEADRLPAGERVGVPDTMATIRPSSGRRHRTTKAHRSSLHAVVPEYAVLGGSTPSNARSIVLVLVIVGAGFRYRSQ
jgi:hypothetical protein